MISGFLAVRKRCVAGTVFLASCGAASAASVTLQPSQDNSIYSEIENSNGAGSLYAGVTPSGNTRRALLQFDLANSGIPAGALVDSVTLSLTVTKSGPGSSALFGLYPLLGAWGEGTSTGTGTGGAPTPGDATWNYRFLNTDLWTLPGGDFAATGATTTIGVALGVYTFSSQPKLVTDVQAWLDAPAANFGWVLKSANELVTNAREFGSGESSLADRPTLTINYTPAPEPGSLALVAGAAALLALRRPAGRRRLRETQA